MTAFFEQPGSRWFNIPAHRPFAEDLAQGLFDALSPLGPEALADAVVLTPTRRGARALADAFIKASGGHAVLPPQMRPLGDLEAGEPPFEPGDLVLDLPAAIDPLRRRFELVRLVTELADDVPGGVGSAGAALDLADALGGFFDGLQIEEIDVRDWLADLAPGDLAEHWEVSRRFLDRALLAWPARLEALGVADVSERRVRLLRRLETLARGAGLKIPDRPEALAWAQALDAPGPYSPVKRPSPKPPVDHRPDKLFVTRVETLTRDPYAVWARDILGLYQLERPDEEVEARARGTAIHAAFERFVTDWPEALPPDAADIFRGLYLEELEKAGMPRDALARETALAVEAAAWVADLETRRRADGRRLHVEKKGEIELHIAGRPFTLAAKADRIEVSPDGLGHVLDYKTGRAPSKRMVETGFSPQLTLTAAILEGGGFKEVGPVTAGDLTYLEISGRRPAGREEVRAAAYGDGDKILNTRDAVDAALQGLERLITRYADPAQGYTSRTAPQFVKMYVSDYDHLARVFEWSTSGEDDE